jgi:hypothetical protein
VPPELRRLALKAYLRRLSLDDKPILVGPWRSEVGFEALYQIPFLRWVVKQGIEASRLYPVTRGGASVLYQGIRFDDGAIDLYSLRTVREVAQENIYDSLKTKLQKQTRCTRWDKAVLRDAATRVLGKDARYHILHPAWMYWALDPFWSEDRGLKYLLSMTDYTPLPKPEAPSLLSGPFTTPTGQIWAADELPPWCKHGLPERYVAVKFYRREPTFPIQHDTAAFVQHVVSLIAQQTNVVLLNSGHAGDDHADLTLSGPNIHTLPKVPPEQNLALQAAVLGKATAFVGTYGGVAQLALRMGVPSVSFWTQFGGTACAHLSLSNFLSQRTGVPFLTGSLADYQLWSQLVVAPIVAPQAA